MVAGDPMPPPQVVASLAKFEIRTNFGQAVVVNGAKLTIENSDLTSNTGVGITLMANTRMHKTTVIAKDTTFDGNDGATGPTSYGVCIAGGHALLFTSNIDFKNNNRVNVPRVMGVFDATSKGWVDDFAHPSVGVP